MISVSKLLYAAACLLCFTPGPGSPQNLPSASTPSPAVPPGQGFLIGSGAIRIVGGGVFPYTDKAVSVISKSLANAEAEFGVTFTIGSALANCEDFSPFSESDFLKYCSITFNGLLEIGNFSTFLAQDYTKFAKHNSNFQVLQTIKSGLLQNGLNVEGALGLWANVNNQFTSGSFAPSRLNVFSLKVTGYGLLPWSVVKQNILLIAIQRAALYANGTLEYGACNVSTSISDISDLLNLLYLAPPPEASSRGRRRLFNSNLILPGLLFETGLPDHINATWEGPSNLFSEFPLVSDLDGEMSSAGRGCKERLELKARETEGCGLGGGACAGQRRELIENTAKNDTIEIYLRLDAINVDQTASDYWATLAGPVGNTSLYAILEDMGMPLSIFYRGAISGRILTDGWTLANVTIEGAPLLAPAPAQAPQPSQSSKVKSSSSSSSRVTALAWILPLSIGGGLTFLVMGLLICLRVTKAPRRDGKNVVDLILDEPARCQVSFRPATGSSGVTSRLRSTTFSNAMRLGGLEVWDYLDIEPSELDICKTLDGFDWKLGSGAYGQVFKGIWRGVQQVALKQLHGSDGCTNEMAEQIQHEVRVLQLASRDRNVVQYYGVSINFPLGPVLVMEYMETGDLLSNLWRPELKWDHLGHSIALDIARGLHFLHSSKIVHRDLKSANILLTREGVAKIADVGIAKIMTREFFTGGSKAGTFAYAAPELLLGEHCTEKVDCYAYGVVLWEIVKKSMARRGSLKDLSEQECPAPISALIKACLQAEPENRPSAAEIVQRLLAARQGEDSGGSAISCPILSEQNTASSCSQLGFPPHTGSGEHITV